MGSLRSKGPGNENLSKSEDLLELLRRIRMDATAIQAKVSDAMQQLAALDLPAPAMFRCVQCGVVFRGTRSLAEHVYNSHGGPVPAHIAEAEQRAAAQYEAVVDPFANAQDAAGDPPPHTSP